MHTLSCMAPAPAWQSVAGEVNYLFIYISYCSSKSVTPDTYCHQ